MESPRDGGTEVYQNGPGHMTKMAPMPIYGKNIKKSSPEPKGWWPWKLVYRIGCSSTPQPLYNSIVGVQANFRVSYPNRVISRVKCIDYMGKGVLSSHLGSNPDPCCIQNRFIMNRVIKRLRCTTKLVQIMTLSWPWPILHQGQIWSLRLLYG